MAEAVACRPSCLVCPREKVGSGVAIFVSCGSMVRESDSLSILDYYVYGLLILDELYNVKDYVKD